MVQDEAKAVLLAPLKKWLEISKATVGHKVDFVLKDRLENVERITGTVMQGDKKQDLVHS
jgi:hypothetical protein